MTSVADRRSTPRVSRRLRVQFCRVDDPQVSFAGYTTNLSRGGTFIETPKPAARNARIRLEFSTDRGAFVVEAKVVRSVQVPLELRQVRTSGMAVRFVRLEELLRELDNGRSATEAGHPATSATATAPSDGPIATDDAPANTAGRSEGPAAAASETQPTRSQKRAVAALRHPAASPQQKATARSDAANEVDPSLEPKRNDHRTHDRPSASSDNTFVLRFAQLDQLQQVWERELQFGGLFLPTEEAVPVDSEVLLKFHLPGCPDAIATPAKVVVVNPPGVESKQPVGLGLTLLRPAQLLPQIRKLL